MKLRRTFQITVAAATLLAPLASFAQTVTTGPLGRSAPALSMPMLLLLAVALAGIAAFTLSRSQSRAVRAVVMVAGLTLLATVGYAGGGKGIVLITTTDCSTVMTQEYNFGGEDLMNSCPNPMQIIAIQCGNGLQGPPQDVLDPCSVGEILNNGDGCHLPSCD